MRGFDSQSTSLKGVWNRDLNATYFSRQPGGIRKDDTMLLTIVSYDEGRPTPMIVGYATTQQSRHIQLNNYLFGGSTTPIGTSSCPPTLISHVEGQEHIPIEVAILAAFYFIGKSSCPKPKTRTCTDCRNGQEHSPISSD